MLPEITKYYLEQGRYYHNLEHPVRMLTLAAKHGFQLTDEQIWAIWGHDLIYVPGDPDNEARSAAAMDEIMAQYGVECERGTVLQIIKDTKHPHRPSIPESRLVIDLDLSGFCRDSRGYNENTRQIRREFAHVSDADWKKGRIQFLEGMLEREPFYLTGLFTEQDEFTAKHNIKLDLYGLRSTTLRN